VIFFLFRWSHVFGLFSSFYALFSLVHCVRCDLFFVHVRDIPMSNEWIVVLFSVTLEWRYSIRCYIHLFFLHFFLLLICFSCDCFVYINLNIPIEFKILYFPNWISFELRVSCCLLYLSWKNVKIWVDDVWCYWIIVHSNVFEYWYGFKELVQERIICYSMSSAWTVLFDFKWNIFK
jgi:hypothetical protein